MTIKDTIANTQARLAAENSERRDQAYKSYMAARANPQINSIKQSIANTKARLDAENAERRAQAHVNYMAARANPKPNSIANTIAKTKARLANEEAYKRQYWAKVHEKKTKQWANRNKWHKNNPTPYNIEGCEERDRIIYITKKFDSFSGKMEEVKECLSPEEAAKKNAVQQARQHKLADIGSGSSSASSRSSSPVASSASSPVASPVASSVNSNGSTSPTLSVKERMKLFQKGGDMASWEAYLAAQRRINETRREGIRPIRIPNVKFNTSSPSTPNTSSPSTPSRMSVKNRIKFFENKHKSVGGKTRKNKSRKSKTKKSRRN